MTTCTIPGHKGGWPECVTCADIQFANNTGATITLPPAEARPEPALVVAATVSPDALAMAKRTSELLTGTNGGSVTKAAEHAAKFATLPPVIRTNPHNGKPVDEYGNPVDEHGNLPPSTNGGRPVVAPDVGAGEVKERQPAEPVTGEVVMPNLPDKFWNARPVLGYIRRAAHHVGRSADAVLGCCLARIAAMTSHELVFDFCLGPGPLNLYAALMGWPAAGKSRASSRAKNLIEIPRALQDPDKFKDGIGLGSGEGLAEVFMGWEERETGDFHERSTRAAKKGDPKTEKVRAQVRHNVYIYVDEGEKLTKQSERKGATAGATIRTAWSGGALGEANATEDRNRSVAELSYSLGMVIGYQPDTVLPLLADSGPGTPQRFLFFSAEDPTIPLDPPEDEWTEPALRLPIADEYGNLIRGTIIATPAIRRRVWDWNNGPARGTHRLAQLDGHILAMHCKLTALFAILDGRTKANDEDWELAATVWETSCGVRDAIMEWSAKQTQQQHDQRTEAYVEREERVQLARAEVSGKVERVAAWIARRLHADGPVQDWSLKRDKCASRDKRYFDAALAHAISKGWVATDGDHMLSPGPSRPA